MAEVVVLLRNILAALIVKAAFSIITSMISLLIVMFLVIFVPASKGPSAWNLAALAFTWNSVQDYGLALGLLLLLELLHPLSAS